MFEPEVPDTADQPSGQRETLEPDKGTSAAYDAEDEEGADLPNTAGLDLPNTVGRSAVNDMVIPSGIPLTESIHQNPAAAAVFGSSLLSEASGDKLINGFASARNAEGSPDSRPVAAKTAKTENGKADQKADPPASQTGKDGSLPIKADLDPHWRGLDETNAEKWLSAFMDGEEAPPKLVSWISEPSAEHSLQASDIHRVLDAAWKRSARRGQKNAPRTWNWFYEVLLLLSFRDTLHAYLKCLRRRGQRAGPAQTLRQ
jgi:hypothetical protein